MMIVALAALAVAALSLTAAFGTVRWAIRALERKDRVHDERLNVVLDRVMHVVNKTWEPPPYVRDADEAEELRQAERARMHEHIVEDGHYAPVTDDPPPLAEEVFDIPDADLT